MSKERLEKIKKWVDLVIKEKIFDEKKTKYLLFLIEQAEQKALAEHKQKIVQEQNLELVKEKPRYREVLKFYANPENWKENDFTDPLADNQPTVYYDGGLRARQVLESESDV